MYPYIRYRTLTCRKSWPSLKKLKFSTVTVRNLKHPKFQCHPIYRSWNIKILQIYKFLYINSIYERNFPNFPDAKLMYILYSLMWVPVFVQTKIWPYFHTLWTRETLAARCQWCIHCVPSSVHPRNHYRCREGEVCPQSGWQGQDSDTSKFYTPMCNW